MGFPGGSTGKESAHNEGDLGLIPGLGRPGEPSRGPHSYRIGCQKSVEGFPGE